jgi:hypothetical protein
LDIDPGNHIGMLLVAAADVTKIGLGEVVSRVSMLTGGVLETGAGRIDLKKLEADSAALVR